MMSRKYTPIQNLYEIVSRKYLKKASRKFLLNKPQLVMFGFDFISQEICAYGRYEDVYLDWIENNLKKYTKDKTILDIGANIGNHSVALAKISNRDIGI